jgi:hypothetical protein
MGKLPSGFYPPPLEDFLPLHLHRKHSSLAHVMKKINNKFKKYAVGKYLKLFFITLFAIRVFLDNKKRIKVVVIFKCKKNV